MLFAHSESAPARLRRRRDQKHDDHREVVEALGQIRLERFRARPSELAMKRDRFGRCREGLSERASGELAPTEVGHVPVPQIV